MNLIFLLATAVQCWPLPNEVRKSTDYTITVDGRSLEVARTKDVHPLFLNDYQWETEGRMTFSSFSYAQFEAEGEVSVKVEWRGGGTNFTARVPFRTAFRPFGRDNALMLAGNAIDRNPPDPKAPGVRYFGPGYHRCEMIELQSGETLYLAAGAWVVAGLRAIGNDITISGHGVLAGTPWRGGAYKKKDRAAGHDDFSPKYRDPKTGELRGQGCLACLDGSNLTVRGVTLFDSWGWTCSIYNATNVTVDAIKIMGGATGCCDGVDLTRVKNAVVKDCFIRTGDDLIAPKWWCEDVLVTNCTLWVDHANVVRIGYENDPPPAVFRNIAIRDCDVLEMQAMCRPPTRYWSSGILQVEGSHGQRLENIVMENVRCHFTPYPKGAHFIFKTHPVTSGYNFPEPGHIRGIAIRNVTCLPGPHKFRAFVGEWDERHRVEDVSFTDMEVDITRVRGPKAFNYH